MKYILLGVFLCSFQIMATAQVDSLLIDSRDGEVYEIIEIENRLWFRENLRYQTAHSYCNREKPRKHCDKGNFYTHFERDTVCPEGWRTANILDWESYITYLSKDDKDIKIVVDTLADMYSFEVRDSSERLRILGSENNPLQLKPDGWIEGRKWINLGTLTLWIKIPEDDPKFHIHVGKRNYIKHSHEHNIIDRKRKRRKFPVRCVCDKKESSI